MKLMTNRKLKALLENEWIKGYQVGAIDLEAYVRPNLAPVIPDDSQRFEVMKIIRANADKMVVRAEHQIKRGIK